MPVVVKWLMVLCVVGAFVAIEHFVPSKKPDLSRENYLRAMGLLPKS